MGGIRLKDFTPYGVNETRDQANEKVDPWLEKNTPDWAKKFLRTEDVGKVIKEGERASSKYDITDQRNKDAEAEADRKRIADQQAMMAGIGYNELGQYTDIALGKVSGISEEEQKQIDHTLAIEKAQMNHALMGRGIGSKMGGSMALSATSALEKGRIALTEQTREAHMKEHWDNFVKATGIATGSQEILQRMNDAERQEAMQIYSSVMKAGGALMGKNRNYQSAVPDYQDGSGVSGSGKINIGGYQINP